MSGSTLTVAAPVQGATTWLSRFPEATREAMTRLGQVESYEAGQTVAQAGAPTHLYLVEEGVLEVQSDDSAPRAIGSGDVAGEGALVHDAPGGPIVAKAPTRARKIDRQEILHALAADPPMLKSVFDALAELHEERSPARELAARRWVGQLGEEALRHRAVRHPYLRALAEGTLPDPAWALADFARHYHGYSAHFPRYLTTVISRLEDPEHRRALLENLTEESGTYEDDELATLASIGIPREWIDGVPHPALFRRFRRAMGVADGGPEADQLVCWRELFLATLGAGSPAAAIGAIGLGTEKIVSTMYLSFVKALDRLVADGHGITARDTVFFPLHTAVDDHHQATLEEIAVAFAGTAQGRAELRLGMLKALGCRSAFWDWLYERALDPARADEVV